MKKLFIAASIAGAIFATGCQQQDPGVAYSKHTDALFAVMSADREVYTQKIIQRLGPNGVNAITPAEHWDQVDNGAPLPALMFRYGAEASAKKESGFSYSLQSIWPINKQNKPKTPIEKEGLQFVADNPGQNFYGEEQLGKNKYFTAVYADVAVSEACTSCHNDHKDSPKTDFKIGDVMGGVVIRVPM